jgi:eukaryotic-like serine/threonine-protein kinase
MNLYRSTNLIIILKSNLFLILLLIFPIFLTAQPMHEVKPEPGVWGGKLVYQNQSTEFYLGFNLEENGDLTATTYMPVIPFPKRNIGTVHKTDTYFRAGAIQFSFDFDTQKITGTFPGSPRGLLFELFPVGDYPEAKEPISSRSSATPSWSFETEGPVWGGASADQENVYIGSTDGNLYSLSQYDGSLKWKFKADGAIFSRPLVHEGFIYTLSDGGSLYKLDSKTGTPIWTFDTGGHAWTRKLPFDYNPGWDTAISGVTISDKIVYTGSADGHLFAIDAKSGTEKWRFKTEGPVHSIPVVADGMVIIGSYDHHAYALNAVTGELNWKFNTGQMIVSSPVYIDGKVIIGSRSADLYAINVSTGEEEWRYFHWGSWVESSGTIFDGQLFIGSSDDQLLKSFDPENGNLLWSANLGGSPWSTPAVTKSTVYSGTFGNANYGIDHRGGFFAIDRLTGEVQWSYLWDKKSDTNIYGVVSSPAAANGMVFFGGLDGVVYGFNVNQDF